MERITRADISRLVLEVDSSGVVKATGDLDIFKRKSQETEKSTRNLDDVMRGLSPSALSAVAGITTLVASFKSLVGVNKTVISNFSHFEKLSMGLETFFQSADKGKKKFEELRKLSNETTFGVDELTDAFTQLANVGMDTDKINDELITLGNLVGGDKAKFADLVSIYSKIQSTGKAGAMQLQQIAMRGIPIYDMLKQIGVQGTATSKQIGQAFAQMTSAGGQFYGAMENINRTIEGKEGFISDYFKELTVNFAELSGIADAYKRVLDILKDAICAVSDKLLEWNENPVTKAIFQGVLVATITTLITLIGGSLFLAIKKINAELLKTVVLKSILDPKTLGIAVAVGVIAGLGFALSNISKETEELKISTSNLNDEYERKLGLLKDIDRFENAKENKAYYSEQITNLREEIKEYEEKKTQLLKDIEAQKKNFSNAVAFAGDDLADYMVGQTVDVEGVLSDPKAEAKFTNDVSNMENQVKELDKTIGDLYEKIDKFKTMMNGEDVVVKALEPIDEATKNLKKLKTAYLEYVGSIKNTKTLNDLKDKLEEMKRYRKMDGQKVFDENGNATLFKFSDKQKQEIDKTITYIQKEIDNIQIKNFINDQEDWQKLLQKTFGFSDRQAYNGSTKSGVIAVNDYMSSQNKVNANLKAFGLDGTKMSQFENQVSDLKSKLMSLATGVDEAGKLIYDGTEKSI